MKREAVFSDDRKFCYLVSRQWNENPVKDRWCAWILRSPSGANERKDDPQVRKAVAFSQRLGFDGAKIVTLYGRQSRTGAGRFKTTPPNIEVGPLTDTHIRRACDSVDKVFCAWGEVDDARAAQVRTLLGEIMTPMWVFGFTRDKQPIHPMYLAVETPPTLWRAKL